MIELFKLPTLLRALEIFNFLDNRRPDKYCLYKYHDSWIVARKPNTESK